VKALDRKLLRDALRTRGQIFTTALVVAGAVAAFLTLRGTYRSLESSRDAYYERQGFAHVWVRLRRAPASAGQGLRDLPGVMNVETRVVAAGKLFVPGAFEASSGQFLSLPPTGDLHGLHLVTGRAPERADEVLVLDAFARAHALAPGDRLAAVVEGKRLELHVAGLAMSPEFIFAVNAAGVYQAKRVGVVWVPEETLAAASGLRGAWNEAALRLSPGANEAEAIAAVDRLTAPFGGLGAFGREQQLSHVFVDNELRQLAGMALWIPAVFLGVGGFLLYVVLGRLLRVQREQIAALKALGYTRARIALHYLELTGLVLVVGDALGVALGVWGGRWFTRIYVEFFHFPVLRFSLDATLAGQALFITALCGVAATLTVVSGAVRVPPAEAMRPPTPASYRVGFLSRLRVTRLVGHLGRMIVRELERRPFRALLSTVGISLGVAILVVGRFQNDVTSFIIRVQLQQAAREDVAVSFLRPLGNEGVRRLTAIPGVLHAEPLRVVPVRIELGPRHRDVGVTALLRSGVLRAAVDKQGHRLALPVSGLMLSKRLAEVLDARIGDRVTLRLREGDHSSRQAIVTALADDVQGLQVYAGTDVLERLLGSQPTASGATLTVDRSRRDEITAALDALGTVAGVSWHQDLLDAFTSTSAEWARVMTLIITIFGIVLAVGVVYNNARVAVSERGRELASLRVLGFTRAEISFLLLGEVGVHLALAIPVGLLIGRLFVAGLMSTMDPDLYRVPLVISSQTYGFALIVVLGAAALSAFLVRRRLDRLDLIGVLKTRE
jgi:putative ABC transport system permease protein